LVTAVIASAIVPTLIAQSFFRPKVSGMEVLSEDEALAIQRQEGSDAP